MSTKEKIPFEYGTNNFHDKLIEWIGDVLYDILPEHGYEVRDEQIFTAFQIADAFCEKKVHLAEAGLGTGKTFAYLLSAILYARYTRKPVIISCASAALQEQLASEHGDIYKLSRLLGLEVDARMAKDPRQYVCDVRFEEIADEMEDLQQWMQQTTRGERAEIPTVKDEVWKKISWNDHMNCETCSNRGYCKLVRVREYYRATKDLIIVDHDTFFKDLWTREERIANGRMPILPDYSAVIFDEGHKIMLPAAMQAGVQLVEEEIKEMVMELETIQYARSSFYTATLELEEATQHFFNKARASILNKGERRLTVCMNDALLRAVKRLRASLDQLLMELQIEQELYSVSTASIQAYESQIERIMYGLSQLIRHQGEDMMTWIDTKDDSFYIVSKNLNEALNKTLYSKHIPIVFSSATLSNKGNFEYFIRQMGLKSPSKSTIGSPFNMSEQVDVTFISPKECTKENKIHKLKELLELNGGRALVLTRSLREVAYIREALKDVSLPFNVLYEDEGDRGYLIRRFKEDETSVLVGADFWEGIDIPGDALTLLIIWSLPFPELDPLTELQRKEAESEGLNPLEVVDYPAMGLKLKQGCGRLIRTETDKGTIVFMEKVEGEPWESVVKGALPEGALK